MAGNSDEYDVPETSADLLPKRLYLAEVLLIPFFWLGPLLALVLGGVMALDVQRLHRRYGVEYGDIRYAFYLCPLAIGHVGSLAYRTQRRQQLLESRGFEPSVLSRTLKRRGTNQNYVLAGWFCLQLATVLALVVVPGEMATVVDVFAVATVLAFAVNLVVGPVLVWWDVRSLLEIETVSWGWTRYLHVLVSAFPFGIFVYLVQRLAHVQCAVIVELWDEDPAEFRVPESEKGRLERLNDRIQAIFA
ncbi:hypothetical protein OB920_19315 [Halobacteria archaeon HArc-gm2]|nr:hypothetical protein [Halobacteria archaeon HArc-gm2]